MGGAAGPPAGLDDPVALMPLSLWTALENGLGWGAVSAQAETARTAMATRALLM